MKVGDEEDDVADSLGAILALSADLVQTLNQGRFVSGFRRSRFG
jgi:hypothetical protein